MIPVFSSARRINTVAPLPEPWTDAGLIKAVLAEAACHRGCPTMTIAFLSVACSRFLTTHLPAYLALCASPGAFRAGAYRHRHFSDRLLRPRWLRQAAEAAPLPVAYIPRSPPSRISARLAHRR
jgi:hypothetical protein